MRRTSRLGTALRRLAPLALLTVLGGAAPQPPGVDQDLLLAQAPAASLAAYRLFLDPAAHRPNARVTPYALNTPLFTDYAEKARFLYLPPGTSARYRDAGLLDLPVGAALVKTFAYPADLRRPGEAVRTIETRLLIRKASGWTALAYVWNAEGTDATLKRAGARVPVSFIDLKGQRREIDYAVPNVNQCKQCHSLDEAVSPIGPKARNLNGDFVYAGKAENQLTHLGRLGLLTGTPSALSVARTPVWDLPSEPLADRARAYLDSNCAHCHQRRGFASNSGLFLDLEERDPSALGVGKRPVAAGRASAGLDFAIAPGDPDRSILVHRMATSEPGVAMAPLGRSLVHDEGLDLVRAYIASLPKS